MIPYLQLHEFEGLLFSSPVTIACPFEKEKTGKYRQLVKALQKIRNCFRTPEEINNNPETSPHRRLEKLIPSYRKVFHGVMIASKMSLEKNREEGPHFDNWVIQLESLGGWQIDEITLRHILLMTFILSFPNAVKERLPFCSANCNLKANASTINFFLSFVPSSALPVQSAALYSNNPTTDIYQWMTEEHIYLERVLKF